VTVIACSVAVVHVSPIPIRTSPHRSAAAVEEEKTNLVETERQRGEQMLVLRKTVSTMPDRPVDKMGFRGFA
jgi:hypothetical protein